MSKIREDDPGNAAGLRPPSGPDRRRWPLYSAIAAVATLLIAGVAVINQQVYQR